MSQRTRTSFLLLSALAVLTVTAKPSFAVVGGLTDFSTFSDPASAYYGLNPNYVYQTRGGTSVSIGYFTLLTADHYAIAIGNEFTINGDKWRVGSMERLPNTSADMLILHMENMTNPYRPLPGFYDLYSNNNASIRDKELVMIGTGYTGTTTNEGYTFDTNTTRVLRWGTNSAGTFTERTDTDFRGVVHKTNCLTLTFSKTTNPTAYESGLAKADSGAGFFYNDNGNWKLAGMGLYVDGDPQITSFAAASIGTYATKLNNILQDDLLPGDLNLDGNVDAFDYITLKNNYGMAGASWMDGDFNGDGIVGYEDLLAVQTNLGYKSNPHPIKPAWWVTGGGYYENPAVPEPASLGLLALGALAVLRRRKSRPQSL